MAIPNHSLRYRPLCGGIAILNPLVAKIGTLGFFATSDGQDRWIVSCYHVIGRIDLTAFADGEPIYQPIDNPADLVARISLARSDVQLDCAAAKLVVGVQGLNQILGMPAIRGVVEPAVGMRVVKSGSTTGLTEGVITKVDDDAVEIQNTPFFPPRYEVSQEGDSGALWVSAQDHCAVALHRAGNAYGGNSVVSVCDYRLF